MDYCVVVIVDCCVDCGFGMGMCVCVGVVYYGVFCWYGCWWFELGCVCLVYFI